MESNTSSWCLKPPTRPCMKRALFLNFFTYVSQNNLSLPYHPCPLSAPAGFNWIFPTPTDGVLTNTAWADQIETKKDILSDPEDIFHSATRCLGKWVQIAASPPPKQRYSIVVWSWIVWNKSGELISNGTWLFFQKVVGNSNIGLML